MNYLAHLYLSDDDDLVRLGNLMGDFVKGRLQGKYPPDIERGIQQHRTVDRFAQDNVHFQTSWQRLDPDLRLIRPLLIDIFYDHFLAKNWDQLHPVPLNQFTRRVYSVLEDQMAALPKKMQPVARRMIDLDWLSSYAELDTIDLVLKRMGRRFRKPVDLTPGGIELRMKASELETDCFHFLQQAKAFLMPMS